MALGDSRINVNSSTGQATGPGAAPPPTPAPQSSFSGPPRPASDTAPRDNPQYYNPNDPNQVANAAGIPPGYLDLLRGYYGAGLGDINGAYGRGANEVGLRDAYFNQQNGFANQDYQNQLGHIGIQQNLDNIDRNYTRQGMGLRDQMIGNLRGIGNLINPDLAAQLQKIGLDEGTNTFNANMQHTQDTQKGRSAQIAGGFGMAPGQQIGFNQLNDILANSLTGIHGNADIARTEANIGAQRERYGNDNSILGQQMSQLGDKASLEKLDQKASQYGLDRQGLYNQLQQQLAKTGLDRSLNVNQLADLAASSDTKKRALGEQLIQQLMGGGMSATDAKGVFGPGTM